MTMQSASSRFVRGVVLAVAVAIIAPRVGHSAQSQSAVEMLQASGVKGGLVVHLGCGDGSETARLLVNDRYLVQGLDTDESKVQQARKSIRAKGLYGKVTARQYDGRHLPYADNLVSLIVAEGPTAVPEDELLRALAPLGVALIDGQKTVKPWPDAIDEWTHYLHGPDNNAVARDRVVAAPRSIQWVAKPMWGRSHEELASMSVAVSAKGRVFFIADEAPLVSIRFMSDWKLIARDAFNGTLLWKRDIPRWTDHLRHFRSGPVHLNRRLVAVGDEVYVTLGLDAPVSALDAATGETLRVYDGTEHAEEIVAAGGVLYLVVGTSEAQRMGEGLFRRGEPEPTDSRYLMAIDAESGAELWKRSAADDGFLLPVTLAVNGSNVVCQSTAGVLCLDARSGDEKWRTPRETPVRRMGFSAPTLVVADGVVLCADRDLEKDALPATGAIEWAVNGWNEEGFARKGRGSLRAYSLDTGDELWSAPCSEGYNSPVDVFAVDGTVWVGSDYKRYDLKTGAPKEPLEWKVGNVAMGHHRCYRNKASENFIFTGRCGIELVSLDTGWVGNNSWIRGTCQYGIMPCNGLIYAPPDACACVPKVKIPGFFAAAPLRAKGGMQFPPEPVLEKGPAYDRVQSSRPSAPDAQDWPMYRHDGARSGVVLTSVPTDLEEQWSVEIGGRLTQPVTVAGTTFVASTDTHTIHALRSANGREVWSYTAGGRIDSSPTVHKSMVLFGSADGWVYALRAANGALVWRFRAAPQDRQVAAFGQLESVWPVHGSVLVQNDTLYVSAGRSTYLDGGIVLYGLDPVSGEQLSRKVISHIDPETDKQTGKEDRAVYGSDMEGSVSEILSGDGDSVFMKHMRFDSAGNELANDKPHLFSITGFLIEEWFVRTYWLMGTDVQGGWGPWARAANAAPSGRILCFDGARVFGYGRPGVQGGRTGHTADTYNLFCDAWSADSAASQPTVARARRRAEAEPAPDTTVWSTEEVPIVRAMVLTSDKLVVAGPPDVGQKVEALLSYENEPEALAGFRGDKGAHLQVLSAADGTKLSDYTLKSLPAFDGMSAANGRLYLCTRDGQVICLAGSDG